MRLYSFSKFIGLCFLFIGFLSASAFADGLGGDNDEEPLFPVGDIQARYNSLNLDVLDDGLVGDHIDLDTGSISFSQMDVSIPGNSALPVQFGRKLSRSTFRTSMMGNWAPDIAHMSRNYATNATGDYGRNPNRCSGELYPASREVFVGNWIRMLRAEAYFTGYDIQVPGRNPGKLVQASYKDDDDNDVIYSPEFSTTTARLVSTENWYVDCISSIPAGGEGYLAHAPNGDTYEFTHLVDIPIRTFDFGSNTYQVMAETLYVTKINDVHGNWVEFEYDGAKLTRIHSNDLRELTFTYNTNNGPLKSVNVPAKAAMPATSTTPAIPASSGRSWGYVYTNDDLSRVNQPDGQYWSFTNNGGLTAVGPIPSKEICFKTPVPSIEIRHPSGTIVQYDFETIQNGRKDVIFRPEFYAWVNESVHKGPDSAPPDTFFDCVGDGDHRSKLPSSFWSIAVTEKRLILPNGPTYTWQRDYQEDQGSYNYPSDVTTWWPYNLDLSDTKTRTVTDPEGHKTVTYLNRTFGREEGKVVKVEIIPSGQTTPIKTTEYTYHPGSYVGLSLGARDHGYTGADSSRVYQTMSVISQDGDSYTTESTFETDSSHADFAYNKPSSVITYSDILDSTAHREMVMTYEHDTVNWILALPKTVSEKSGTETREIKKFDYDAFGNAVKQYRYEQEIAEFGYNSDGTMAWMKDALDRKTEAGFWHRGQPQSITKAAHNASEAITFSQSTDNHGWQVSQTDARGYTTAYEHDVMGRLKKIIPSGRVNGVGINLSPTIINYYFGNDEIRQIIDKGYERRFIYYDRLYRPIMEKLEVRPMTNEQIPLYSITTTEYDSLGRVKFKSLPYETLNTIDGTNYTYDALGRPLTTTSTIDSGVTTSYIYLDDNCTKMTDPEGQITGDYTTTCKDGYGGPGGGDLVEIKQPEGIVTTLDYNGFGELLTVNQTGTQGGNQTQGFFYDDITRRLCGSHVPEAGHTLYEYDAAGQMTHYAKGASASANSCNSPIGEVSEVKLTYDALGRPKTTKFLDPATPDIWRDYDENGNVIRVDRGGAGEEFCQTSAGANCWFYEYDQHNRLKAQELQIDDRSFEQKYFYNAYGYMYRQTLPTGRIVFTTHDGAGRTLGIGWGNDAATGFKYHPNQQVQEFRYGNGVDFDNYQNNLQQLERRYIRNGGDTALDISYTYDKNGRITDQDYNILDGANNPNNRTYSYDGVGRLTSAVSTSFGGTGTASFSFDALGNLTAKTIRGRTVTNTYDTFNRLTKSVEGAGGPDNAMTRDVEYDHRGNITKIGDLSASPLTFIYDMADQPRTVSGTNRTGGTVSGGTYEYDGNLKRVKSVINGVTRYNVYDKEGRLAHVEEGADIETSIQTDYLHAAGMTLARIKDNVFTYMHPDQLGSASAGTDENGAIAFTEFHTPFGEVLSNAAANDNQSDFTGHIRDTDIGMSYMQARYYDPNIGRFLSIDPMTMMDMDMNPNYFNRYAYTANDPINAIDPDGMTTHVLTVNDDGISVPGGDHSAVYVAPDGENPGTLYDPAGSMPLKDEWGENARGTGDVLVEDANNPDLLSSFIEYHGKNGNATVNESVINTTSEQESALRSNIDARPSAAPMTCATNVSSALAGSGITFADETVKSPGVLSIFAKRESRVTGGTSTEHRTGQ